jgi:hypothetical protein
MMAPIVAATATAPQPMTFISTDYSSSSSSTGRRFFFLVPVLVFLVEVPVFFLAARFASCVSLSLFRDSFLISSASPSLSHLRICLTVLLFQLSHW